MSAVIPGFFMVLGAAGLLLALYFVWQSVRAALGVVQLGGAESLDRERARLLERKAALLDGLADLRFEHDAGKIDAADFAVVDAQLREEAKDVLKALDEELEPYRGQADAVIEAYLAGSSLESMAPAELLAAQTKRRASAPEGTASAADGAVTAAPAPRRRRRGKPSASDSGSRDNHLLCPQCMAPNVPDAEFCCECSARVAPLECAACHTVNDADATFCKKCGGALVDEPSEPGKKS